MVMSSRLEHAGSISVIEEFLWAELGVALPSGNSMHKSSDLEVAAENNLSETAFVELLHSKESVDAQGSQRFSLRWFTPTCEAPNGYSNVLHGQSIDMQKQSS